MCDDPWKQSTGTFAFLCLAIFDKINLCLLPNDNLLIIESKD